MSQQWTPTVVRGLFPITQKAPFRQAFWEEKQTALKTHCRCLTHQCLHLKFRQYAQDSANEFSILSSFSQTDTKQSNQRKTQWNRWKTCKVGQKIKYTVLTTGRRAKCQFLKRDHLFSPQVEKIFKAVSHLRCFSEQLVTEWSIFSWRFLANSYFYSEQNMM